MWQLSLTALESYISMHMSDCMFFPLLDVLSFCSSQHWFHNFPDTNYQFSSADRLLCKAVSLMQLCDQIFKNVVMAAFSATFPHMLLLQKYAAILSAFLLNYYTYIFSYTYFISTIFIAPHLLLFSLALNFFPALFPLFSHSFSSFYLL